MYRIIGGDGREYGPITKEQLQQWIAEGRADAQSQVRVEGSNDWKPLASFSEFAGAFASVAAPAAKLPPPSAKTSGMAIAALVLGILGVFCWFLTAIPGLILGIISLNKINRSGGQLGGKGLALAGIIVSSVMLMCGVMSMGMLLPALNAAREKSRRLTCLGNLKSIGLAIRLYSADNNERFPTDAAWTTLGSYGLLMQKYQHSYKELVCPSDPGIVPGTPFTPLTAKNVSYAYNGFGLTEGAQPDTPIVCDRSSAGDPVSTSPWNGNTWTHKSDGGCVLFLDGHVAFQKTLVTPMYHGKNP
jgi:prepilin-type processing-associated H-X9-DG protein